MPFDPRDTRRRLGDIQHHIAMAERFVADMGYEALKDDDLRIYAVVRYLEIISDASRRLPDALKARHTSIEWREMAAAGNFYRHEYEDVAARRVWVTLTHDLPLLRGVVAQELAALSPSVSRGHAGNRRKSGRNMRAQSPAHRQPNHRPQVASCGTAPTARRTPPGT
jgi:uncharacterized protein with HEPN domain